MKNKSPRASFWLAAAVPFLLAAAAVAATVTVVVEQSAVRARPQFYAPAVAAVKLGDKLEVQSSQNGWDQVSFQDQTGWIHQSAVTDKQVKLDAARSVGQTGTSAEEITLAGKGFNEQVEQSYSGQNPQANYAAVDAMEKNHVGDKALLKFLRTGGLAGSAQ